MKRRRKLSFVLTLVIILSVTAISLTNIKKADGTTKNNSFSIVTVEYGDTLWDIVKDNCSNYKDIRKAVYDIKKYNNLPSSNIIPGTKLKIPACYTL